MTVVGNQYDWGIKTLVNELREIREQSLEQRQRRHQPPKLPSRNIIAEIIENLGAVLFPNRLGQPDLKDEGIDYFVGHTLDSLLRQLHQQLALELNFIAEQQGLCVDAKGQAAEITRQFAATLPTIRRLIDSDIQAAYEGDPAARCADEVLVCYPGIVAVSITELPMFCIKLVRPWSLVSLLKSPIQLLESIFTPAHKLPTVFSLIMAPVW